MSEHELRMPFGKHKGTLIKELPGDYLKWLSTIELHGPLRTAVTSALKGKAEQMPLGVPGSPPGARSSSVGTSTPSPAHSNGVNRGPQRKEAAKPKRAWIPRPEGEDLSQYYTAQGADNIPW